MEKNRDIAYLFRSLVGLLFLIIIVVTGLQVILRYVFNSSLVWSEELVRFLVIWMCMIAAAVHSFDDTHMVINSVIERFPVKIQFLFYTVRQILICVFSVSCAIASIKLLKAAAGTYSGALNISFAYWRGAGTAGLLLITFFTIIRYVQDIKRLKHGKFYLGEKHEKGVENK